ncbi:MAG: hypothetical protein PWP65_1135 [Clostridia bacterium]|nr:hypothetical protein [Clostridia bacterium]
MKKRDLLVIGTAIILSLALFGCAQGPANYDQQVEKKGSIQAANDPTNGSQMIIINPPLSSIHMLNANIGWAISDDAIFRTTDGGRNWSDVTEISPSIVGSFFLDAQHGWAASKAGDKQWSIHSTADGGTSWQRAKIAVDYPDGESDIFFLDENHGWILIDYGGVAGSHPAALFQTDDGGKTWTEIADTDLYSRETAELPFGGIKIGISFRDRSNGWLPLYIGVTGGLKVLNTEDGGKTWKEQVLAVPKVLETMTFWPYPPLFFNDKDGVLPVRAGEGNFVIYHSNNGGKTWASTTPLTDLSSYPVYDFVNPEHGFVTDGTKIYQTSDGGTTWSPVQPNISLKEVKQVDFVSLTIGWALTHSNNNNIQLYRTQDGGEIWSPMLKTP